MGVYNDLVFTEAVDQAQALLASENTDEISDRLEKIANGNDRSMAVMMLLLFKARGRDISDMNGIELANAKPSFADLVLPPGVQL